MSSLSELDHIPLGVASLLANPRDQLVVARSDLLDAFVETYICMVLVKWVVRMSHVLLPVFRSV